MAPVLLGGGSENCALLYAAKVKVIGGNYIEVENYGIDAKRYFDISWEEVAKYIVSTPESLKNTANMVNRYPDRFLFGPDEVAPANQEKYLKIYNQYEPFWKLLSTDASEKVRKGNYERIFDEARRSVRSWEATNVKTVSSITGGLK